MTKKKPVSKLKPITRTKRLLLAQGWMIADRVEEARGLISFDWGGFIDIIAWRPPNTWLLVQCTGTTGGAGNVSVRIHKIAASVAARAMIFHGERVEVWGWDRYKEDPRVVHVMPRTLECPVIACEYEHARNIAPARKPKRAATGAGHRR